MLSIHLSVLCLCGFLCGMEGGSWIYWGKGRRGRRAVPTQNFVWCQIKTKEQRRPSRITCRCGRPVGVGGRRGRRGRQGIMTIASHIRYISTNLVSSIHFRLAAPNSKPFFINYHFINSNYSPVWITILWSVILLNYKLKCYQLQPIEYPPIFGLLTPSPPINDDADWNNELDYWRFDLFIRSNSPVIDCIWFRRSINWG